MSWPEQKYVNYSFLKTTNIQPQNGLGQNGISIGKNAGYTNQRTAAIAIGNTAGYRNQGTNAIAIGINAGYTGQGTNAIAIGINAGQTNQQQDAIAIGLESGQFNQGTNAIGIGTDAGQINQGGNSIAIGELAGQTNQRGNSIAIGYQAGQFNQGSFSIAIGSYAGHTGQSQNAIAIGSYAGQTNQAQNTVVINGAGPWGDDTTYQTITNAFFLRPVRGAGQSVANVNYNAITFALNLLSSSAKTKHDIKDLTTDTSVVYNLNPRTFVFNVNPSGGNHIGYIAEEVEMINYHFAAHDTLGGEPNGINFNTIIIFLVEELKKLKSTVDTLTQENQDFLERLIVLENK